MPFRPHSDSLTPLERRLLCQLALGKTSAEAADSLNLTPEAADALLAELLRRHGLTEPRRLVARALVHRWI